MRGKERAHDDGFGYVLVPEELLRDLETISDEALRVVLYLHLVEHREGVVGVPVPFAEITEHCGLGRARTARGLSSAAKMREVEQVPGTDCWRLLPPSFSDA